MHYKTLWALLGAMIMASLIPHSWAAPGDLCFEKIDTIMDCYDGNVFNVVNRGLLPLEAVIPNYSLVVVWGGILGILWFKTENVMLIGVVGVIVASTFTVTFYSQALGVGLLMFGVSLGIMLFQLLRQRIQLLS